MKYRNLTKLRNIGIELTCFKAYDIRGEININIDEQIVYSVGRAVAQHFDAKSIIVGFDARETSPLYAKAAASGIVDAGANVLDVGLAGTERCTGRKFVWCLCWD